MASTGVWPPWIYSERYRTLSINLEFFCFNGVFFKFQCIGALDLIVYVNSLADIECNSWELISYHLIIPSRSVIRYGW